MATIRTTTSAACPRAWAMKAPMGTASPAPTSTDRKVSCNVGQIAAPISCATGRPVQIEVPRSPRSTPPIHCAYC
jgi:hypothetical protein